MINYKEIIKNLTDDSIKELLTKLEIPFRETESALIMPTACHNEDLEDASWKLYYYKDNHIFYCYTECACAMSIFKFLKHYYETRGIIYDWYQDIYEVVLNCSSYNPMLARHQRYVPKRDKYEKGQLKTIEPISENLLNCFTKFYPSEWLKDGISKDAIDKFNILFSISQNKIIIPHYNPDGRLIGIRGRALDEWEVENIGKYTPVKVEDQWYSHPLSLNLYGLNLTKENIKKYGICYVFESEKSVLQLESFNLPNCGVAVCGSNFNKFALKLLLKTAHPQEVILCFDSEENEGEEKYFNKLYKICSKYTNYVNMSFVYDRKHLLNKKDSPSDRGEDIFRELIKKRIKVK